MGLKDAASDSNDVIKSGRPPVPFIVGIEPLKDNAEGYVQFQSLVGVSSLVRMFAAMNSVAIRKSRGDNGTSPSLGDPTKYINALNDTAEATVKALTAGPLAGMYQPLDNGSTQTEEQLLKRADIHSFVLPRIFGGLPSITKEHMEDLDDILTKFVASIKPFKISIPSGDASDDKDNQHPQTASTTITTAATVAPDHLIKFVVLIHHVKTTDVTGDGAVLICEPMTRMVNLSIRVEDWARALQKPGKLDLLRRNEKVALKLTTTIVEMRLDEKKFIAAKPKFETALKMMVGKDPALTKIVEEDGLVGYGRETCNIYETGPDV